MFDTRTDSWRNDTGWLQLSWFRNSCYFNLFLLYFLKAERKKEKKQTTFTCASWKTKTIWVFRLNLKANSTERFVQQHHKTADKPVSKTERGTKKKRKKTPVATFQTVAANASLSVHAFGGELMGEGGGNGERRLPKMEGLPPPFTKLCQIQNKYRAQGENWCSYRADPPVLSFSQCARIVCEQQKQLGDPCYCSASSDFTSCFWHWTVW